MLIQSNFSTKLSHIYFKTISHQNQIEYIQNSIQLGETLQMSDYFQICSFKMNKTKN